MAEQRMTPGLPGLPGFGNIPTPLEVADAVIDSVAEVASLPSRVVKNVATAVAHGAQAVESGIAKPKDVAEVPAPPDAVVEGGIQAATGAASGLVEAVSGVVKAVQDTGQGVVNQINALTRR